MFLNSFVELGDHDGGIDPVVNGDREGQSGVVIDPCQDLPVGSVGELDVGHVGLPALVGEISDESGER